MRERPRPGDSPTVEGDENAKQCPSCGGTSIARIMYGLPAFTPDQVRDIDEGRLVTGGCCVSDDMPTRQCNDCSATWGRLKLHD